MFSINEQIEYTNKDIVIAIKPPVNTQKYTYRIYDNETLINYYDVVGNKESTVNLKETGNYKIKVEAYDKTNNYTEYLSGIYNIDKDAPVLTICEKCFEKTNDYMDGVKAKDNIDGNITTHIKTNYSSINFDEIGTKKLVYEVYDSAGNYTSRTMNIEVVDNSASTILLLESLIIIGILAFISLILKYRKMVRIEQRFGKYSVKKIKDNSVSITDRFLNAYKEIIKRFSKAAKKSVFLTNYSNHFEKYASSSCSNLNSKLDIVSSKFLISIFFLIVALISKTIQLKSFQIYEMVVPMLIGFFLPDIFYYIKYKIYRKKIENDLLQGIIIMNNAFKSGRSITQAINLVASELKGPISEQFSRIGIELASGIGIDQAFKRFSDRINIEEVTYLTASLTILNSTGGNIVKVFSSIEHSLFAKKKLRLELASLTSSSKIIIKILFAVPLLFVLFVLVINPNYFDPFFSTNVGLIVLCGMIVYYILYIFAVKRIMKVRM